jgi:hypothetical protein
MTTLGRRKKCLRNRSEKGSSGALRADQKRNRPLPALLGNTVDQYRLDPLQGEIVRPIQRLESESENGNSSLLSNRRRVRSALARISSTASTR